MTPVNQAPKDLPAAPGLKDQKDREASKGLPETLGLMARTESKDLLEKGALLENPDLKDRSDHPES